jgi:hypothetical protein
MEWVAPMQLMSASSASCGPKILTAWSGFTRLVIPQWPHTTMARPDRGKRRCADLSIASFGMSQKGEVMIRSNTLESHLAAILSTAAQARAIVAEAEAKLRALECDDDISPCGSARELADAMRDECGLWDDETIEERFWQAHGVWEEACAEADWRRENAV